MEAHAQKPFAALLLNGANAHPAAIDAPGGLTGEALWESSRRSVIPRSAQDLANELNFLLRQAREVLIIDAYFNPSVQLRNSKWLRPIQTIASALPIDGRLNRFAVRLLSTIEIPEYFAKFTPASAPYDLVDEVDVTGA